MDLIERGLFLLIGGGIGFILGYIVARLREIKEEVDEVLDIEKRNNGELSPRTRGEEGFMRYPVVADAMLLLVIVIVVYAAFQSQKASNDVKDDAKEDQISRCQAGVENRNVQRQLVEAVYNLATGAAERPSDAPPLTSEEIARYNSYIKRANDFREQMYDKIEPSEECAPYVEDDNVDPPTESIPPINIPKEPR